LVRIAPPILYVSDYYALIYPLENGKLGLGEDTTGGSGLGRLRKDAEVALDLLAGAERVEEADDRVLRVSG
jgi:hypothetical protein